MLPSPLFLVQLAPTDPRLKVGLRVQWPGEDQVWVWSGAEWVAERVDGFDGGDLWEAEEERPAA